MRVFNSIDDFTPSREGTAIFIGKADALHLGHIALINETLRLSDEISSKAGILSLIPDVANPIFEVESLRFILTENERLSFLSNWPLDYLIYQKMNRDFTSMSAKDFVRTVLKERLGVRGVVVGWDFKFGQGRHGDTDLLKYLSVELSFQLRIIEPVEVNGRPIKTSYIRELIDEGKVRDAWKLLGYPFFVTGIVVKGQGLGNKLGFPTANIKTPPEKILPLKGVYIGRALFGETCNWGLINVGKRPTVNEDGDLNIEIWLKDFKGDLYGTEVKVEFFEYLRDEIKFVSMDDLKTQVNKDFSELEKFLGID